MNRIVYPSKDETKEDVTRAANENVLKIYREGWATGETETILSVVKKDTYNFTWVPNNDEVSSEKFPEFFSTFKKNAVDASSKEFRIIWSNIIQRQEGDTLLELGDWIIEGFARGTYFNAAQDGLIIWEMATTQ